MDDLANFIGSFIADAEISDWVDRTVALRVHKAIICAPNAHFSDLLLRFFDENENVIENRGHIFALRSVPCYGKYGIKLSSINYQVSSIKLSVSNSV